MTTENTELMLILKEQNVAADNAQALIKAFGAPFTEAGKILSTYKEIAVTDRSQTDAMKEARSMRLALARIRYGVENKRKELKEDALRSSRAIDGVARYIRENIQPAEDYLALQERFIEIEDEKAAATKKAERVAMLAPLVADISYYNYEAMTDEQFSELIIDRTAVRDAAERAKELAETERLAQIEADAKEAQRVLDENAELKKQAEQREIANAKRDAAERAERAKADKLRAAERAKADKLLAAERAKAEAERQKREAVELAQRTKDAEAQRIADQKAVTEAKAQAEADELERKAILAPDKDKLLTFAKALAMIRDDKLPAVKSNAAQEVVNYIDGELTKLQATINAKAAKL